jgi:hypothetical protein
MLSQLLLLLLLKTLRSNSSCLRKPQLAGVFFRPQFSKHTWAIPVRIFCNQKISHASSALDSNVA